MPSRLKSSAGRGGLQALGRKNLVRTLGSPAVGVQGGDTIVFHESRRQNFPIRPNAERHVPANVSSYPLQVQPGRLLLFPAWLYHSVPVNRAREERMSVAANIMFLDAGAGAASLPLARLTGRR